MGTNETRRERADEGAAHSRELERRGWIVLFAMLFCGIIVIMNQYKVPTFMGTLMQDFGTSPGTTGWLMSVIAVAGIVTAFPSAFLLNRFGPRRIGLFGLAFMIVGCAVGALASTFAQLIVGRLLEGVGVAMMGVVATTIISMYFPREKAGLPMGIWNLWYVVGSTLAYNIGVPVALALTGDPHNWHAWWWFSDALALVAFIVFALLVSVPHAGRGIAAERERATGRPEHRPASLLLEGFKVKRMWLFGLGFCFLMFTSLSVLTWVPTYVQEIEVGRALAAGASLADAQAQGGVAGGSMASLGFAASIPMALVTAFLLGRFQTLRARNVMVVIAGFCAFFYVGAFLVPYDYLPAYLVLLGLESGWTSGVVWSMVPVTMPKRVTMPVGMAIIIFFQGVSNLLCTPVVGYVIGEAQVWTNVAPLCAATATIGTVLWIVYVLTKPPVFEEDEEPSELDALAEEAGALGAEVA
ncbi:MAG: MFS transporter [Eggerthellaceae bacterium]|nr:MFS transporter [Eggerthellaceae bacterium]